MAKRIVDEEMRFTVVINGNEAQKELLELDKATRDLQQSNKNLKEEQAKLRKLGLEESARFKQLTQEINANDRAIEKNGLQMQKLQDQIGVTSLSMRQLNQRSRQLRAQLHHMVPGSAEFKRLQFELDATTARIKELRASSIAAKTSIGSIADGFNRYFALGASLVATGTGMVLSIQKMIDYNGKLSDAMADVRKTTGLTQAEIEELSKSFGMMKTRTARTELLKLAEDAGRLGITGVKNLRDYVEVANQIKVALGDDLNETQIQELGKMTSIYEVGTQTGKEFAEANLALGSAINEVSASGANQAGYLVDYLKRQAGIAKQAKISADQNIGYAATFDEIGQSVEISATAMNKVWMDLYKDTATYAKIAGMSVKDFSALLETDANEAMIRFLEGLNGNNEGLTVMVKKLEDIDVGGARGAQALSALAGSTAKLRDRQLIANKALSEATSITDETAVKNENLAATLDKIKKQMVGWFTSDAIINGLDNLVNWFAKFIGATEDAEGGVTKFRNALVFLIKLLIVVTAAMVTNVAWLKLTALWTATAAKNSWLFTAAQKAHVIATEAAFAASQLYAAATMLLTGNIKGATQAIRVMSATLKTTPWGMVLGLVAAIGTAYYMYSKNVVGAAKAEEDLNEVRNEVAKSLAQEKMLLDQLLKIAKDEEMSKDRRLKAIKKINDISPQYLKNISLENINTDEATKSINSYVKALEKKALAQAIQSKQQEAINDLVEKNLEAEENYDAYMEGIPDMLKRQKVEADQNKRTIGYSNFDEENQKKLLEERARSIFKAALDINKKEHEEYTKKLTSAIGDSVSMADMLLGTDESNSNSSGASSTVISPRDATKDENLKSRKEELRRLKEENDLLQASLISDSFQKEMALEQINHDTRIAQLRDQMIEKAEMVGLSPRAKQMALDKNQALRDQIFTQEEIFQFKKATVIQKGIEDDFKLQQEKFEREKVQRETAHNLELAALGNDEVAKKALQEKFNKEEADREAKHLQELITQMNSIMNGGDFKGFDLELLSPEQKQALLDFLDEANLQLSALINKASGTGETAARIDGDVDVLGFSIDDWTKTFENLDTTAGKIEAAQMAVGAMMNAWSMYSNFVAQKERASLQEFERNQEARASKLQRQLDSGYINQRQYNRSVEELEKETQRKRAEMEYKQAKREKEMAVANIILNTAAGVAKAIAQGGFVLGVPWAAIVGALGAVQLGMALATPLPAKGYEEGLYPVRREQDGKIFNARNGGNLKSGLVKKPTILVAEKDPEMIIDGGAWKQMHPGVKDSIYRELGRMGRVPGYEGGYYRESSENNKTSGGTSDVNYELFISALNRNSAIMEKIERNGINANLLRSLENAKKIQDDINDYNDLRNSNKK